MKPSTLFAVVVCILWMKLGSAQWRGYYTTVRRSYTLWESYCTCWYWWWGCSHYRGYWKTYYYYTQQCQIGWKHSGDKNCNIPVCKPACINGGTCVNPNVCECPSTSRGRNTGCSELTCSYKRPCYPGDCLQGTTCTCEPGFLLNKTDDGCIIFDPSHEELKPVVGRSNVTLSDIRRTDNRIGYMFVLEGTNLTEGSMSIVWSNQKRFNNLRFEYESYFEQPENLPERPNYVSQAKLGIVNSFIEVNVSKVSRNKDALMRDEGSFKRYKCDAGFSPDNPAVELASCVVNDDQFKTLIEHGDWLNVKFKTDSGGFQKLINLDQRGELYGTKYYKGLQDVKEVQFNFDFIAPKHCSEKDSFGSCSGDAVMLKVEQEFTKRAIKLYWHGWEDDLSKTYLAYYVEIFKLSPDPYGRLIEMTPLAPAFNGHINYTRSIIDYPEYQPSEPGMYSVLMETKDLANNSRITRRFVLYDDQSEISLNNDRNSSLYVSSAVEETGYTWIRPSSGREVTINVIWKNHFVNKIHEENKLLNEIQEYPIQFKEIQDDGVLFSQKFVADALDDHEGERTRDSLQNYHGIVKFEIGKEFTLSDAEPSSWEIVSPFQETSSFSAKLDDGYRVRVWIRATDVMGNTKTDSTLIRVDGTPPTISSRGSDGHEIFKNIENGEYNYTSRLTFAAADQQSGVHKLEYTITLSVPEKDDKVVYTGVSPAMISNDTSNPFCQIVEGKCFIPKQQLDLDNCWFMPMKSELDSGTAVVNVTVYNQALLSASTLFQVGKVNTLKGLEKYDGPFNIRIESPSPNGFRVAWDLPEKTSCYGRAEIVIVLLRKGSDGSVEPETYYTSGTKKYFDILGLNPSTDYEIKFAMKAFNSTALQDATSLSAKTARCEPLPRRCRKFKNGFKEKAWNEYIQTVDLIQCPPSSSPFSIYSVSDGNSNNSSKDVQDLLVCWRNDVKRFALQFEEYVHIDDALFSPHVSVRSCVVTNDTILYSHKPQKDNGTFHLLLNLERKADTSLIIKAFYSHKTKGINYGHNRLLKYTYTYQSQPHRRRKRQIEQQVKYTPSTECGATRSCFRNGATGCNHFECTYFLSYNITDNVVDFEMSAKTTGWVGVGFSSDDKMGGDEVIVCRKMGSGVVQANVYKNPFAHQDPKIKEDPYDLTLNSFQISEGYLFCRVSRPLSTGNQIDLSNEWHQLYAYGPVSTGGELEKHATKPLVSRRISIVQRSVDVQSSATHLYQKSTIGAWLLIFLYTVTCLLMIF